MIVIYRDNNANAIFVEDNNGAQFLNNLQAFQDDPTDTTLSIRDIARDIEIISDRDYTEFEDDTGTAWGTDGQTTTNALNSIFQSSGGGSGNVPVITSPLTINLTTGNTLNYELTADFGVGYEWDLSAVSDVVTVEGNVRKLIGGSTLSAGTYNIPVKAINYYGEDAETIVLTVSSPLFSNTLSTNFVTNDYLNATANTSNPFYRLNQGSATAWCVSFWFKAGTSNNQNQTILSFGGDDLNNEGRVWIIYNGGNASRQQIILRYGTDNNYLQFITPANTVTTNTWNHYIINYDGGTTENGSGGIATSYSRFKIYKNGSLLTTSNSNSNFGYSGEIRAEFFRVGRQTNSGQYMRNNCRVDELALWASDEQSNVSSIYNSGTPFDLTTLASPPDNWWRMGDSDIFPTISDNVGSLDFTMVNMTVADFVSDVP
jgi:hypothetical protein